jgi:hypothetical protein
MEEVEGAADSLVTITHFSRFLDLLSQEQSFSNVTGCFDR